MVSFWGNFATVADFLRGITIQKPATFYGFLTTFLRPLIAVNEFCRLV
jgi:hypothetical protein